MVKVCQVCHERPATVHLCEIIEDKQAILDLCESCFRSRSASSGFNTPFLDGTQKCYYCDEPSSCATSNLPWEEAVRKQELHYYCSRCGELLRKFTLEAMDALPKDLGQDEAEQAIQRAVEETDMRVREHVRGGQS